MLDAFPVQGPCGFGDSFGYPRSGGRTHEGIDIIAAEGNELYAVADGKITKTYADYPGSLGNGIRLTKADGTYFFYAHMSQLAEGIELGVPVTAGQLVGYVGNTGNSGTRTSTSRRTRTAAPPSTRTRRSRRSTAASSRRLATPTARAYPARMPIIDIQLSGATSDWPTLRTAAREAETRGYGAVWVLDHLAGLPLGGTSMIEAFTLLGALAEATDHIELGTMVANVWNRQPGTLVTAMASVAHVADRQVHLGLGAGAAPGTTWAVEQDLVGTELSPVLADRHARVAHVLDLVDEQWSETRTSAGDVPAPRPRPTTIVGVNSVALARLAAERADGVNILVPPPARAVHRCLRGGDR
ncbi:MAG: LLM class flavin-dependent oxidoreductase [Ilumatobacteraceae bacterium]